MKNKNWIYILIIVAIVGIILMLTFFIPFIKKLYIAQKLERVYKEDFKIVDYKGNFLKGVFEAHAYSKKSPNLRFYASVDTKSKYVTDSYVSKIVCDKISKKVNNNLKILNDNYYVFTQVEFEGTIINDKNISIEDYLAEMPRQKFYVYLCIDKVNSSNQDIVRAVNNMLNDLPMFDGRVYIYFTDSTLITDIKEYVSSHDKLYASFDNFTLDSYVGSVNFYNSHVALTEYTLNKMINDK